MGLITTNQQYDSSGYLSYLIMRQKVIYGDLTNNYGLDLLREPVNSESPQWLIALVRASPLYVGDTPFTIGMITSLTNQLLGGMTLT